MPGNQKYCHSFGRQNTLDFVEASYFATYYPREDHLFGMRTEENVVALFRRVGNQRAA